MISYLVIAISCIAMMIFSVAAVYLATEEKEERYRNRD
jgi:hypothetical protein